MLLSTKITYSVRSLAYIANYTSGQRPIPLSEIAQVGRQLVHQAVIGQMQQTPRELHVFTHRQVG